MKDPELEYKLNNNPISFSVGGIIDQSFTLFSKKIGLFVISIILIMGISTAINYLPVSSDLLSLIYSFAIQPVLLVGVFVIADKVEHGEDASFKDLFSGFKHQRLHIILANFLLMIIFAIPTVLFIAAMLGVLGTSLLSSFSSFERVAEEILAGAGIMFFISFLVFFIVIIYLSITFMFAGMFVYFKDLSAWEGLKASQKLTSRNFFNFLGFAIVLLFMNLIGMLFLGLGLLLTIPVSNIALYKIFNSTIGTRSESTEEDRVIEHLITE